MNVQEFEFTVLLHEMQNTRWVVAERKSVRAKGLREDTTSGDASRLD